MKIIEGAYVKRQKFAETLSLIIQEINPKYFFREDRYSYSFSYWIMEKLDPKEPKSIFSEIFSPSSGRPRTVCNITLSEERLFEKAHWTVSVGDTEEMKVIGQALEDKTGIPVTVVTS